MPGLTYQMSSFPLPPAVPPGPIHQFDHELALAVSCVVILLLHLQVASLTP
jgi:hypothetical protein